MTELTESSVRAEVRTWLEAHWRSDCSLLEWRNKLVDSGWGAPHWPTQWSPFRSARVTAPAASDPLPGSLNNWHQASSPVRLGRR